MTFPKMSQTNPVDKAAHQSDLDFTLLPPIFVLITLPVNLGSPLIRVTVIVVDKLVWKWNFRAFLSNVSNMYNHKPSHDFAPA